MGFILCRYKIWRLNNL